MSDNTWRETFEDLLNDEPPIGITLDAAVANGRRRVQRRWGLAGGATLLAAALATAAVLMIPSLTRGQPPAASSSGPATTTLDEPKPGTGPCPTKYSDRAHGHLADGAGLPRPEKVKDAFLAVASRIMP